MTDQNFEGRTEHAGSGANEVVQPEPAAQPEKRMPPRDKLQEIVEIVDGLYPDDPSLDDEHEKCRRSNQGTT